jgi:hypothetical protein
VGHQRHGSYSTRMVGEGEDEKEKKKKEMMMMMFDPDV